MSVVNLFRGTIALFLNSPAKNIANFIGIDEARVAYTYLDLKNKMNEEEFSKIDPKDRIIFLPQCLRSSSCKAPQDELGYHCQLCGKCKIATIVKEARKVGSKVFVLPGADVVPIIIKKFKPQAILGVACIRELVQCASLIDKYKITGQGVLLLRGGCKNTDVDLNLVNEKLNGVKIKKGQLSSSKNN